MRLDDRNTTAFDVFLLLSPFKNYGRKTPSYFSAIYLIYDVTKWPKSEKNISEIYTKLIIPDKTRHRHHVSAEHHEYCVVLSVC